MIQFPLPQAVINQGISEGWDVILPDWYDELYEYYLMSGQMPYGVAKARTGDPDQWIVDQLEAGNF
jgi:hypothetical protein